MFLKGFFFLYYINDVFGPPWALGASPSDSSCPIMYISSLEPP